VTAASAAGKTKLDMWECCARERARGKRAAGIGVKGGA